jgi:tRNA pseudouridine32 synthase/23S rRNA pseudouridine746 synthase
LTTQKLALFHFFESNIDQSLLPESLILTAQEPHELCIVAATELQQYLSQRQFTGHNFGITHQDANVVGKMFGVLVVQSALGQVGYLSAFSGKLGGTNSYREFVPPVFDLLTDGSFLNLGMQKLTQLNSEIKSSNFSDSELLELKAARRNHSKNLQKEIFKHYQFVNQSGVYKSLLEIFSEVNYNNPPAGAGECAGIKLLQYAFLNQMKPIAMTEFWWGQSPKSDTWKHGNFYPCCKEKCAPILKHMLS